MTAKPTNHGRALRAIWQQMNAADDAAVVAMAEALEALKALKGSHVVINDDLLHMLPSCSAPEPWLTDQELAAVAVNRIREVLIQVMRCAELRSSFAALLEAQGTG